MFCDVVGISMKLHASGSAHAERKSTDAGRCIGRPVANPAHSHQPVRCVDLLNSRVGPVSLQVRIPRAEVCRKVIKLQDHRGNQMHIADIRRLQRKQRPELAKNVLFALGWWAMWIGFLVLFAWEGKD